jgi:type IV secretory pathway component VirB8
VLTDAGKTYATHESVFTKEAAVFDAACKPALVWTEASIRENAIRLDTLYTFVILVLAVAVLMSIQAAFLASGRR